MDCLEGRRENSSIFMREIEENEKENHGKKCDGKNKKEVKLKYSCPSMRRREKRSEVDGEKGIYGITGKERRKDQKGI